jgi:hypothetical protein
MDPGSSGKIMYGIKFSLLKYEEQQNSISTNHKREAGPLVAASPRKPARETRTRDNRENVRNLSFGEGAEVKKPTLCLAPSPNMNSF